jgi:ATP-dependent helicase/nuclease subunit B
VLAEATHVLAEIVTGIEHGVFAPRPSALSTYFWIECHACNPDGLGTAELRKQWERKRFDPALARYADLAEPLEVVEP